MQFMFNPSQVYMTFVQHIYTCKRECYSEAVVQTGEQLQSDSK